VLVGASIPAESTIAVFGVVVSYRVDPVHVLLNWEIKTVAYLIL
jgi:hypothetical protein